MRVVSVIGDGKVDEESDVYKAAYEVGKLVASKGYVLACGGLFGVMEAAAKGAKEAGGITVGILPTLEAISNSYIDIKIPTGMGEARNVIVVSASSGIVVAVGGNYGTLSEIAHALKMGKRVLGYKTWQVRGVENYEEVGELLTSLDSVI